MERLLSIITKAKTRFGPKRVIDYTRLDEKDPESLPNEIKKYKYWQKKIISIDDLLDVNFSHDLNFYNLSVSTLTEGGEKRKLREVAKKYLALKDHIDQDLVNKIDNIIAEIKNDTKFPKLILTTGRNVFKGELFILDGNHRALALAVAATQKPDDFANKKIETFVGRKKTTLKSLSTVLIKIFNQE